MFQNQKRSYCRLGAQLRYGAILQRLVGMSRKERPPPAEAPHRFHSVPGCAYR
ncbi:MAG: hypothetical protein ACOCWQ_02825 [Nanoarchaeota archaeon]